MALDISCDFHLGFLCRQLQRIAIRHTELENQTGVFPSIGEATYNIPIDFPQEDELRIAYRVARDFVTSLDSEEFAVFQTQVGILDLGLVQQGLDLITSGVVIPRHTIDRTKWPRYFHSSNGVINPIF